MTPRLCWTFACILRYVAPSPFFMICFNSREGVNAYCCCPRTVTIPCSAGRLDRDQVSCTAENDCCSKGQQLCNRSSHVLWSIFFNLYFGEKLGTPRTRRTPNPFSVLQNSACFLSGHAYIQVWPLLLLYNTPQHKVPILEKGWFLLGQKNAPEYHERNLSGVSHKKLANNRVYSTAVLPPTRNYGSKGSVFHFNTC